MTVETVPVRSGASPSGRATPPSARSRRRRRRRPFLQVFFIAFSALWLIPIVLTGITALRNMGDLMANGLWALPANPSLVNFVTAWTQGNVGRNMLNGFIITLPAVFGTLLLSSMAGFALARRRIPGSRLVLIVLLVGSMMPAQLLAVPIYTFVNGLGIYDTWLPVILVHIAMSMGFNTFILHNYVTTLPESLFEAAEIDGASVWRTYVSIVIPLVKPALAALATLEFTQTFNDFFWATLLLRSESKVPVTVGLVNLQGVYTVDWTVVAAGAFLAVIPTMVVYLALQRHFERGLTVGVER